MFERCLSNHLKKPRTNLKLCMKASAHCELVADTLTSSQRIALENKFENSVENVAKAYNRYLDTLADDLEKASENWQRREDAMA